MKTEMIIKPSKEFENAIKNWRNELKKKDKIKLSAKNDLNKFFKKIGIIN